MPLFLEQTGLLAAWDGFGFLVFFLVAFISWLINFLSPKPPGPGNPRRAQDAGRGKQIQSEIDQFLQQARELVESNKQVGRRNDDVTVVQMPEQRVQKRAAPPPQRGRRTQQEIWETQAGRQPQPGNRGNQPSGQNQGKGSKQKKQNRPGEKLSHRHLSTSVSPSSETSSLGNLGANRSRNPQEQKITAETSVFTNLPAETAFRAPLSQSSGEERHNETRSHKRNPAAELVQKLRSPLMVRDAIVVNEVLNRPLALRRRS